MARLIVVEDERMDWQHWDLDVDETGRARLTLAVEGKSVNVLTRAVLDELAGVLDALEGNPAITGMILCSGKPGFVYGADINEFEVLEDEEAVADLVIFVHGLFNRLAALPFPTVAAIDGYALGGGLELALTCDRLVATASPKTCLAFPEIKLGLMPGYGGTGRAWARVGSAAVLDMMLTGRMVKAAEAAETGLVDSLADPDGDLLDAAGAMLAECSGVKPERRQPEGDDAAAAAATAREAHLGRLRPDHTPAPFAIIDHIARHAPDAAAISAAETDIFPVLMMTAASDGLRRLFSLQDMVRKEARGDSGISRIHVIGAGVMGGDIAAVAAMQGIEVTLADLSADALEKAGERARALFTRRLKSDEAVAAAMARLVLDPEQNGLAEADLVIEAVSENPEVKKKVFTAIEGKTRLEAILATNTSSIPLEEIATALEDPSRLVGIHFFNPVPVLPLVEIIWSEASDQDMVQRSMRFAGALGKMPIRCKSAPGFLVNRALLPYVLKGIAMMLEGTDPDLIDQAMTDFGMPMGPVELADQIGLDVTHDASLPLGMDAAVAAALKDRINAGDLGRKSGRGFYEWDAKKALRPRAAYDQAVLSGLAADLLSPMIDQCRQAVAEGVVDSAEHADAGMIFGTGFPGFRGGPLHHDDQLRTV
ncbi:MAG: 3-hydroxyacyl-CoA dehydrogenase NAD-binding domain-containing protein [Candidatus Puniceispirillales bacterium]